ncbi:MAG: putative reductase [Linnemannia gamsii]|nr:MAG: putative reductase [Linnemannia gamsii]
MAVPRIYTLSNGVRMPSIGLGTYRVRDQATLDTCLLEALRSGYRLIDTASVYRNEAAIGSSLKRIFEQNLVPGLTRQDIFLTSKLAPKDHGYDACYQAVTESLRNLQVDYIDLYLIHWPGTAKLKLPDPQNAINRMESWRALEDLYHAKRLRAIGVSNYTLTHLAQLIERPHNTSHTSSHHPHSSQHSDAFSAPTPTIARTMVIPHVHQFEMHPRHFQKPLVDYCQHHRIQVQAYSSLGESRLVSLTPPPPPVMDSNYNTAPLPGPLDTMPDLIRKYFPVPALATANNASIDATTDGLVGATTEMEYPKRAAQILLRWGLQHGAVVIPKSTHPERIRNNIDLFSFEIDAKDMAALDAYSLEGKRTRYCWDSTEVF